MRFVAASSSNSCVMLTYGTHCFITLAYWRYSTCHLVVLAVVVVAAAALVRGFARLLYLPQEVLACCRFVYATQCGNLLIVVHMHTYTQRR